MVIVNSPALSTGMTLLESAAAVWSGAVAVDCAGAAVTLGGKPLETGEESGFWLALEDFEDGAGWGGLPLLLCWRRVQRVSPRATINSPAASQPKGVRHGGAFSS